MSRLAQQIIEKENDLKTGRLDLGNCGLYELPLAVLKMDWLEELILSNAYIKSTDQGFNKDFWINSVNKGQRNEFSKIPKGLDRLKNLKTLLISGIPNHVWKIEKLNNLPPFLHTLDISYNRIEKFDNLPASLKVLNILHNRIEEIKELPNELVAIDLSCNAVLQLKQLPLNLAYLDISFNQIHKIENLPSNHTAFDISTTNIISAKDLLKDFTSFGKGDGQIKAKENIPQRFTGFDIRSNKMLQTNNFPKHLLPTEAQNANCLLYTSPSPRDLSTSRMPSSA